MHINKNIVVLINTTSSRELKGFQKKKTTYSELKAFCRQCSNLQPNG